MATYFTSSQIEAAMTTIQSSANTLCSKIALPNPTVSEGLGPTTYSYLKIAKGTGAGRVAVLAVAGVHAREWAQPDAVISFARKLITAYQGGTAFVIPSYTDPAGSRTDFGALLVGYYDDDRLKYAGKVGTGYTAATLRRLGARLRELESPESPFVDARPVPRGTHWTLPELVAQIGFAEWTSDGRLRQARFLGLRDDKPPAEVVRERAVENP